MQEEDDEGGTYDHTTLLDLRKRKSPATRWCCSFVKTVCLSLTFLTLVSLSACLSVFCLRPCCTPVFLSITLLPLVSLYTWLSVCLWPCCLFLTLLTLVHVSLYICLSVSLFHLGEYLHLPVCLSVCLSEFNLSHLGKFVHLSVSLTLVSIYTSVCLWFSSPSYVCTSVSRSVYLLLFFSLNTVCSWYVHFSLEVDSRWEHLSFHLCCDFSTLKQDESITTCTC